ncbi:signal peptidase I [Crassaminicella thermophila]|uniref:Signal peptidase I n=1 Tax=Crassaminicella thermophila TaxID=2599308 RepID=A0A5C0SED1_CRATE|nr:signal peptidase I [Crassaminicella thermophila]QEK12292.1 signal peptidase I [Crassaminicella thermophila]
MKNKLIKLLGTIIITIIFVAIVKILIFECIKINGNSMFPTLEDNERLIVNKFAYIISKPQKGDIILFKCPYDIKYKMVKRVVATEGDTIEIINGNLLINDHIIKESYVLNKTSDDFRKRVVPENTIFVLGDNRNNSKDSRFKDVGFIPLELVEGKCCYVIWPIKNFKKIR